MPSLPFVMKTSREGPSVVKPTREELQARVKSLAKKKMSVKRRAQAPLESSFVIRGKVLRLGAPSPPSIAKGWGSSDQVPARGQAPPSVAEVSKVAGPEISSRRSSELPFMFCLFLFRIPWRRTLSVLLRRRRTREGVALEPKGRRTHCLLIWSLQLGPCRPFYGILISGGRMPCLLRMFWPYRFRERPPYVRTSLFICPIFDFDLPLPLSCFGRWLPM